MTNPLVSIVIPAYKSDFFKACLDSALHQTYVNIEIIVSDDCPTDAISKIVEQVQDDRIHYYRNEPAYGPMFNYMESFNKAKGDLIKFLNDDDLLDPQCLEIMVPMLLMESVALVTTYRKEIDADGYPLPDRDHNKALFKSDVIIDGLSLIKGMLVHQVNVVGEPSCILFRKKDVQLIKPHFMCFGGYGYEKSGLGDVGLELNLLNQGDCAYLGEKSLVQVRVFKGQWQQVSDASKWSSQTWYDFRHHAIELGLMSWFSLGWSISYYKEIDGLLRHQQFICISYLKRRVKKYLIKYIPPFIRAKK